MKAVGVRVFGCLLGALILQGIGTVNCLYAEYPSWGSLWKHWYKGGGRAIPDAYKRLSDQQKAFEEKEKNGKLSKKDEKERLRFFWEVKADGEAFDHPPENLDVSINDAIASICRDEYGKKKFVWDYKITSYMRVVTSKQFLVCVLTRDFVDALDKKCESSSCMSVRLGYYSYPDKNKTPNRRLIEIEIITVEWRENGCIEDLALRLRLTLNMQADEIEKVELVDGVIMNDETLFHGGNGTALFEKK